MQDEGYIKLYRKALDKGWLKNHSLWAFWSWCLLKATYTERDVIVGLQKVHLYPGQFIFGRKSAAAEIALSEQQIRTLLNFCVNIEQNLTIKSTSKFSIITIVNWDDYQGSENISTNKPTTEITNDQPATNQQLTTNKKVKKEKKVKNNNGLRPWPDDFVLTDHLRELASEYIPADKIDMEWSAFRARCLSKGEKYADWDQAWTTRYINYAKYSGGNGGSPAAANSDLMKGAWACHEKCHGTCAATWDVHHDKPQGKCYWCKKFDHKRAEARQEESIR